MVKSGFGYGVLVCDKAAGVFADNDVSEHAAGEVAVSTEACPTFTGNRMHSSAGSGIQCFDSGRGVFERNEVSRNAVSFLPQLGLNLASLPSRLICHLQCANVEVFASANPRLEANTILDGGACGVLVRMGGFGTFKGNSILRSAQSGVSVQDPGSDPIFDGNLIQDNTSFGVHCHSGSARGTFKGNTVGANCCGLDAGFPGRGHIRTDMSASNGAKYVFRVSASSAFRCLSD
jgi:hypothetical protein